jgi:hypothetical protein
MKGVQDNGVGISGKGAERYLLVILPPGFIKHRGNNENQNSKKYNGLEPQHNASAEQNLHGLLTTTRKSDSELLSKFKLTRIPNITKRTCHSPGDETGNTPGRYTYYDNAMVTTIAIVPQNTNKKTKIPIHTLRRN